MPIYSAEEIKNMKSETDHTHLEGMTDEQITAAALSDPDNPPLNDALFEKAKRVRLEDFMPTPKEKVCLRLDREVVGWFRARQKKGYQTAINAALRAFIASQGEGERQKRP
ncbi:MAG: BrnA antitoxin family protein [Solidesulfovibrio sp.]